MTSTIAIIILGMHRSGTSALAGSLQEQGVFFGKVFENNPHNKKGNRENKEIVELNESLFAFNNSSWLNPPASIRWTKEQSIIRTRIIQGFINSGCEIWGFKDPRTLFTLDFWLDGLISSKIELVGSFRHPLAVAYSLLTRNGMPIEDGVKMWEKYNLKLLEVYKRFSLPLVSFDVSTHEYKRSIKQLMMSIIGNQGGLLNESLFFDNSLRHETFDDFPDLSKEISELYNELKNIYMGQF